MKNLKQIPFQLPGNLDVSETAAYQSDDGIRIIKTIDNTPKWGPLLHVSISRADRNPTWEEIKDVKVYFFGRHKSAMMILPKESNYVNEHPYCFHLIQTPQDWDLM